MKNIIKQEKGQILVILAIAMVGLLGITALALDGSMTYSERRADQSSADSAALAGAGAAAQILKDHMPSEFYCGSSLGASASTAAALAAKSTAAIDSVDLLINDLSTKNGVQVTCGQDNFRRYLDIHVMVTTETDTMFGNMVGRSTLTTTVESTARVYPKQTLAYGNAIATLSKSCGKIGGIDFGGNSTVKINKGGIFSNSCIDAGGSTVVEVTGGQIQYYTAYSPGGTVSPNPDTRLRKDYQRLLLTPLSAPAAAYTNAPTSGTINPGNYNGLHINTKENSDS